MSADVQDHQREALLRFLDYTGPRGESERQSLHQCQSRPNHYPEHWVTQDDPMGNLLER